MARFIIILLFFSLVLRPDEGIAQGNFKNIVIFFGGNETLPVYSRIVEGLKSSFPFDSSTRINLISEYLDLERLPDSMSALHIVNLYNERIREKTIDLVITVAPGAYDALKKYGLQLLEVVPVINLELTSKDAQDYLPDTRVVELLIEWSPGISMAHAFELFPECKHAYFLGGCALGDLKLTERFIADTAAFMDTHRFTILSCTTMDAILDSISKLPDSCLVFIASYSMDANKTPFSTSIALQLISTRSSVPVFTMSDNFIEYGGLGGKVISFTAVGRETGLIAKNLFKKDGSGTLTKIAKSFYLHQYNWLELKKWGLQNSKVIPKTSTFYYKPFNFFDEYRWQIIGVLLLIIIETILIYYLIRLVRAQKKVATQKLENEELYRLLLREERVTTMSLLTASLAHELNQPLSAILFNAQAGLRFLQSGKLNEDQAASILKDIQEDVKRASGVISSVRSMMKMETREKKNIEVKRLIADVLNVLHSELKKQEVKVDVVESDQALLVRGDEVELQQVLINLILNAVRAMKANLTEDKLIQIRSYAAKDVVAVSIVDSGPGLPDSLKGKLFDPFISTESDGMGIGLALCKSIIQRHGGEISAINRPEGGAEFSFTLPLIHPAS